MADIVVTIPAQAEFIKIIRSVMAAAGASVNLPYDEIDDLRLAVDEACSHLLSLGPRATKLTMKISISEARLDVVASSDGVEQPWPAPGAQQTLAWQVLAGLTDDVGFEQTESGSAIRFSKQLSQVI